jgi:hypothetical protein
MYHLELEYAYGVFSTFFLNFDGLALRLLLVTTPLVFLSTSLLLVSITIGVYNIFCFDTLSAHFFEVRQSTLTY